MKKAIKFIGGLVLTLVLISAAQAAVVTISSNTTNSPANPILNSSSANLAAGRFVQVIDNTTGTVSAPSTTTGAPQAGGTVLTTGTLSAAGVFTKSGASIPTGHYVYIVAWETWNGSGTPTGKYGISAISPMMTGVSYTYKPASFSTTNEVNPVGTPTLTGISPVGATQGQSNLSVTLTGSNTTWSGAQTVTFSGSGITVNSANATSATTIAANISVAADAATGVRTVSVSGTNGTVNFTVNPATAAPAITRLESIGNPGTAITSANVYDVISVIGTNFGASQGSSTVTINGVSPTVYYWSAAKIDLQVPNTTSGNVLVTVNGTASNAIALTINNVVTPTLTGITPNSGAQGQTMNVTLNGSNTTWSGSGTVTFSGSGITVNSANATSATTIAANITIAAGAATGARTVNVPGTSGSATFTVLAAGTPSLISITPNSGAQGTANLSVQIVGANTSWSGNMASAIQVSGSGVAVVNATATSANAISATLSIASDATVGAHNVTVTGASGSVTFTVTSGGGPNPTAIIIDSFEGTEVGKWATQAEGGYYTFQNGMITPNNNLITGNGPVAEALKNGTLGMKVRYSYVANSDPDKDWGDGWGGQLRTVKDLSAMKSVTMNMRWDGSTNAVKFGFQDAAGHVAAATIPNSALMAVTTYGKISVPAASFTEDTTNPSRTPGAIDWAHITNYNFAYLNKGTTANYQYIDDITALTTDEVTPQPVGDAPVINSITPAQAPTGTTITVVGLNFGTVQGMSKLIFTNLATNVGYEAPIVSWSDTRLIARVPQAPMGSYEAVVNKMATVQGTVTLLTSNKQAFQVTSSGVDTVRAYPNPFNPNIEVITLVFNPPTGAANSGVYIYDMTARLVSRVNVGAATQTTWDGKDQNGNTVGDGAYLVRVVNEETKSLIAKGKILVVKH